MGQSIIQERSFEFALEIICLDRKLGGVLLPLHTWEGQPFAEGPDMVGQTSGQGRRSWLPLALRIPLTQRPHGPAKVVAVQREVTHGRVNLPVLGEAIGLPRLAGVAVPIRAVV